MNYRKWQHVNLEYAISSDLYRFRSLFCFLEWYQCSLEQTLNKNVIHCWSRRRCRNRKYPPMKSSMFPYLSTTRIFSTSFFFNHDDSFFVFFFLRISEIFFIIIILFLLWLRERERERKTSTLIVCRWEQSMGLWSNSIRLIIHFLVYFSFYVKLIFSSKSTVNHQEKRYHTSGQQE